MESPGRQTKLHEVGAVTIISVCCFLTRAVLLIISIIYVDLGMNPYLIMGYYLSVEIVPAGLLLLEFHSHQYWF